YFSTEEHLVWFQTLAIENKTVISVKIFVWTHVINSFWLSVIDGLNGHNPAVLYLDVGLASTVFLEVSTRCGQHCLSPWTSAFNQMPCGCHPEFNDKPAINGRANCYAK
ncbi:unnamed protein product, partial [Rangifer tarandus platyrhynchus]